MTARAYLEVDENGEPRLVREEARRPPAAALNFGARVFTNEDPLIRVAFGKKVGYPVRRSYQVWEHDAVRPHDVAEAHDGQLECVSCHVRGSAGSGRDCPGVELVRLCLTLQQRLDGAEGK